MSRQGAVLLALVAIAVAALLISVGSLIILRRAGERDAGGPGASRT